MPTLERAFGYQGDHMNLPVADVEAALPFYERVLGFTVLERRETPYPAAVIGRDAVRMGLVQNGGDSTQDGCAFHVNDLDGLLAEFQGRGLARTSSDIGVEDHGEESFRVFYVVAPDGLCYWFGERLRDDHANPA